MVSKYEVEVRYFIDNIREFEERLKSLGRLLYPYEFTDYYFKPKWTYWDPERKNIRIRVWKYPKKPTRIYLVKNEILEIDGIKFKRSLYEEGKLVLYEGDYSKCKEILEDLGFEEWIVVEKRNCKFYEIYHKDFIFRTVLEFIPNVGWVGELEFEGEDPNEAVRNLRKAIEILEIPEDKLTYKPVLSLVLCTKN